MQSSKVGSSGNQRHITYGYSEDKQMSLIITMMLNINRRPITKDAIPDGECLRTTGAGETGGGDKSWEELSIATSCWL
jgi:hypothetical protein